MKIGRFRSNRVPLTRIPEQNESGADRTTTQTDDTTAIDTTNANATGDATATVVVTMLRLLLKSICLCMNETVVVVVVFVFVVGIVIVMWVWFCFIERVESWIVVQLFLCADHELSSSSSVADHDAIESFSFSRSYHVISYPADLIQLENPFHLCDPFDCSKTKLGY